MHEGVVALLIALCPLTATGASTSAPPPGANCYYISRLRRVWDQLCGSHHLSLQEEVMVMRSYTVYQMKKTHLLLILSNYFFLFLPPPGRRFKEQSAPIHLGLAASLAFLHLLFFLTGVLANVGGESVCTWVGAGLHYALLSSFSWMGLQVFHTFWLIYKVFSPSPKTFIWMLVGFGEHVK